MIQTATASGMGARGAFFLDRDGTVIVHKPYLFDPAQVELLPGAANALRRARAAGFLLFLFTNQSGVGRGYFTLADVDAVNRRMLELLGEGDDFFTGICIAPEAPDQPSRYRKPSPRYILEMLEKFTLDRSRCWMVGDSPSDWEAGIAAGIRSAAVSSDLTTEKSEARRTDAGVPMFESLDDVVQRALT